jgi:hypothetical protein
MCHRIGLKIRGLSSQPAHICTARQLTHPAQEFRLCGQLGTVACILETAPLSQILTPTRV